MAVCTSPERVNYRPASQDIVKFILLMSLAPQSESIGEYPFLRTLSIIRKLLLKVFYKTSALAEPAVFKFSENDCLF